MLGISAGLGLRVFRVLVLGSGLGFSGFQGLGQCEYSGLERSGQGECWEFINAGLRLRVFMVSVLGSGLEFSGFQDLGQYECS